MNKDTGITLFEGTILSGTYQIIRQIGQGGMGTVYMAYDTRLDIKVAIKVKPFKQVRLSNTDSGYRQALSAVIMSATAENPVTNQQYAAFLNANLDRIEVIESDLKKDPAKYYTDTSFHTAKSAGDE